MKPMYRIFGVPIYRFHFCGHMQGRVFYFHVNRVAGSAGFAISDVNVKDFSTTTLCECSLSRSNSMCDRHPLQHTVADYEIFFITDDVLFPNPLLGDIFAALGAILCHAN